MERTANPKADRTHEVGLPRLPLTVLRLVMAPFRTTLACFIACAILMSCARLEVHLHDRHSLSYPLIESYAKGHPGTTLVLLDYGHDVGPIGEESLSSNWVAMLLHNNVVSRVLWVSGRDLLLPNRNARTAWMRRKLTSFSPREAATIEDRVILTDWHDLEKKRLGAPLVVSLDFDIFCHDPGTPPERFLDEVSAWMRKQRPGLVTLALSAAYENDASSAWHRLGRFVMEYGQVARHATWFLEAGQRNPAAEGVEEDTAWQRWEREGEIFGRRDEAFLPGAGIWIAPPDTLRASLLGLDIKPGDETARDIVSGWRDSDLAAIERLFPQAATDEALAAAAAALEDFWRGERLPQPQADATDIGVALRIEGKNGDRGCLALYRGASDPISAARYCAQLAADDPRYPAILQPERPDLALELSVFGPWHDMAGPLDFRPGLDSLILRDGNEVTLLQAPVAAQRGYDREEFLARLSNKAGLGLEGWKRQGLLFMRSSTIWSRRSLSSIEATPHYQKYEKK